jgi:ribonuclease R
MTYDEVLEILDGEAGGGAGMLFEMQRLSASLNRNRLARGAIELVSYESRFTMDENGFPIDVERAGSNAATSVIEEFMIVCNEVVARTMRKAKMPLLYRVHEASPPEKLDRLFNLVYILGAVKKKRTAAKKNRKPGKSSAKYSSKAVQVLIDKVYGTRFEEIVSRAALSCMLQAVYSGANTGHYGLASACYCHFTAPIRRYPDLFCHRMVKAYLRGGLDADEHSRLKRGLTETARHLSAAERRAAEAERKADDLIKVRYMSDKVGRIFNGKITSIHKWGMYVGLPNTVEGLVGYHDMSDDYYVVDEANCRVYGERGRKVYRLGDSVRVCVVSADIEKKHLNFVIVDKKLKL